MKRLSSTCWDTMPEKRPIRRVLEMPASSMNAGWVFAIATDTCVERKRVP